MTINLFDRVVGQLAGGLQYAGLRHEVIARNIANAETPGYRAQDLVFDRMLAASPAAETSGATTALAPPGRLTASGDVAPAQNGNDVHLDRQMARLAENTIFQHTLVGLLTNQFAALKQAISGRV